MATCDHVLAVTGIDPAAPWRGSYSDEAGAMAIYQAHGGVLGLMRHGMALAGFQVSDRGELRPVVCRFGTKEIAGVDLGKRVAFMGERGLVEFRGDVIEAWAL